MKFNPDIHKRKSLRLKNYDYSTQGLYFITIAVQNKLCLLGSIENNIITKSSAGEMIENLWYDLENNFPNIKLHDFIVMPNHVHGIIEIVDCKSVANRVNTRFTPTGGKFEYNKKSISSIMQAFKSKTTHQYIQGVYNNDRRIFNKKLWQKDFYEHIIRDEKSYHNISQYIQNNPVKWAEDKFYYTEV